MKNALDMNLSDWQGALAALGVPAYRAQQVDGWLVKGARFSEMTNLPKPLLDTLSLAYDDRPVSIDQRFVSRVDSTVKYLFRLSDGCLIEGVRMRYHHGDTLCLSTQVGCRMGCTFCASTIGGLVRNLTCGEMLGQVLESQRDSGPLHNLVLMGSGEPLDNYDAVVAFLRRVQDPHGLGVSLRHVSLSTCGLIAPLKAFCEEGLAVTLSVSLHAPTDALRTQIMPMAAGNPLVELMDACRLYIEKTGRRVIFEYALIDGVNAGVIHAEALARLVRGMQCHVNLIPLNPVPERSLTGASTPTVYAFEQALRARHVSVTIRREMGADISGACGQLKARSQGGKP